MACCHAITYVDEELVGDPLEIKMFEMTKWKLEENPTGTNSIIQLDELVLANLISPDGDILSIIKRFDFESKLQRMSAIIKNKSDNKYYSFVKGSPEMIKKLSLEDSLPTDYDDVMN